jgi:hypothetical protein
MHTIVWYGMVLYCIVLHCIALSYGSWDVGRCMVVVFTRTRGISHQPSAISHQPYFNLIQKQIDLSLPSIHERCAGEADKGRCCDRRRVRQNYLCCA